jgi:hypothetical protein
MPRLVHAGREDLLAYSVTHYLTNFFQTKDLIGLRTFAALDDIEFDLIALFQALVALALD